MRKLVFYGELSDISSRVLLSNNIRSRVRTNAKQYEKQFLPHQTDPPTRHTKYPQQNQTHTQHTDKPHTPITPNRPTRLQNGQNLLRTQQNPPPNPKREKSAPLQHPGGRAPENTDNCATRENCATLIWRRIGGNPHSCANRKTPTPKRRQIFPRFRGIPARIRIFLSAGCMFMYVRIAVRINCDNVVISVRCATCVVYGVLSTTTKSHIVDVVVLMVGCFRNRSIIAKRRIDRNNAYFRTGGFVVCCMRCVCVC